MTYARELGGGRTGGERSGSRPSPAPGKSTLTSAIGGPAVQRKADGGAAAPEEPGKATLTGAIGDPGAPAAAQTREAAPARDLGGDAANQPPRDPEAGGGVPDAAPGAGDTAAATVVGSAAENERAMDGLFTPALIADLQAHPQMTLEDALQRIANTGMTQSWDSRVLHHPTIVQVGRMPRAAAGAGAGAGGGKKRAVMIANEDYVHISELGKPKEEAGAMQSELASRGYESAVHHDKSAVEMGALWGTMVGTANRGDQLVAHYGGHGEPAGLVGINHGAPPTPPDLYRNAQVAGVVSAATDKGAQIRFVIDSCHAGAAVDAVREERHNELAAATGAGSVGDELRIATMTGLRAAKQRLLDLDHGRRTVGQLRSESKRPSGVQLQPPAGHGRSNGAAAPAATRHVVFVGYGNGYLPPSDRLWQELAPLIEIAGMIVKQPPPPIGKHAGLGERLNYLDDLWNALQQPMEDALAASAQARTTP